MLDNLDRGQEILPLQTVRIQAIGRVVGGGQQHHAALQHRRYQPAQDHRIGNVVDVKFVQTQHAGVFGDVVGEGGQRVFLPGKRLHLMMDFGHEIMEVDAAFAAIRQARVKRIHQKCLTAPDPAPEIQTVRHFRAEQAAPQEPVAFCLEFHQLMPERIQFINRGGLGGVINKAGLFAGGLIPGPGAHAAVRRNLEGVLGHGRFFQFSNVAPAVGFALVLR